MARLLKLRTLLPIPIKIQCGCGQHYAFDVEPLDGFMPAAIACPACGADGTGAANEVIAQSAPTPPAAAIDNAPNQRLRVAAPSFSTQQASAPEESAAPEQQLDHTRAINEARSKIFWGDTRQEAIVSLVGHGISTKEAGMLVDGMLRQRAIAIRANGIRKIFVGIGLIFVPIVSLVIFLLIKFIPIKLFAITVMIGAWGAWMVIKGTFMTVAPRAEPGDVANQ
jgi:hypothetical protein